MKYPPSTLLLLLVLATIATVAPAFTIVHQRGVTTHPHRRTFLAQTAAEEENNNNINNNHAEVEAAAVEKDEEEPTLITPTEASAEEPVVEEDPAMTALKQEIADLESAVKAKNRQVSVAQEQAERYTQAGYARRVAEVENMRRLRKSMENSNASTATASIIQSFLPSMDQFFALKTLYDSNDFGSQYSGLSGAMASALKGLDVENYTVDVGAAVSAERATVVKEEHSKDVEAGKIIRVTTPGMELKGNIIRPAEVVVSLGVAEAGSGFGKVAAKETE